MRRMSGWLAGLGAAAVAAAVLAQGTQPAAAPIVPTEKTELFNGKDLSGWAAYPAEKAEGAKVWTVKDGVLACAGRPNGYLGTEKAYANYKLTVEWRFVKGGNTGVLVHMNGPEKVWPETVECQGMHKAQGDMYFWSGAKAADAKPIGGGFTIKRKGADAEKALGEWNTYQVVCVDDTVSIVVNGTEMNKATGCSVRGGRIGLQCEGAQFEVRKVTIEPVGK